MNPEIHDYPETIKVMAVKATGISDLDVLLGKGVGRVSHVGTIAFMAIIKSRIDPSTYGQARGWDKTSFTVELVHEVTSAGGRFLKGNRYGEWYELDRKRAREKVRECIRGIIRGSTKNNSQGVLAKYGLEGAISEKSRFEQVVELIKGSKQIKIHAALSNERIILAGEDDALSRTKSSFASKTRVSNGGDDIVSEPSLGVATMVSARIKNDQKDKSGDNAAISFGTRRLDGFLSHSRGAARAFIEDKNSNDDTKPKAEAASLQSAPNRYGDDNDHHSGKTNRGSPGRTGQSNNSRTSPHTALINPRRRRQRDTESIVPLPPKVIGGLRDQIRPEVSCTCRQRSCLKLYCKCFQKGSECNDRCACHPCQNFETNENRLSAILSVLGRNPDAFRPAPRKAQISCNCKKSKCVKKVCECFASGVPCSKDTCTCTGCGNNSKSISRIYAHDIEQRKSASGLQKLRKKEDVLSALEQAIPVCFRTGELFPPLAFGSVSPTQRHDPVVLEPTSKATQMTDTGNQSRSTMGCPTELQTAWHSEADKVGQVYDAMRTEARNRNGDELTPTKQPSKAHRIAGAKLLADVESDARRLVEAMVKAESDLLSKIEALAESKQKATTSDSSDHQGLETIIYPEVEALRCNEVMEGDNGSQEISDPAVRETTILLAQDTALLQELTAVIRQRALQLAMGRVREGADKL